MFLRDFLGGPVVKTACFHCGGTGLTLVMELGSHMLHGAAKKKKLLKYNRTD